MASLERVRLYVITQAPPGTTEGRDPQTPPGTTEGRDPQGRDLLAILAQVLAGAPRGSIAVQVRDKRLATRELVVLARAIQQLTQRHGCPLLINDRLDIALAVGADGVHLPENGLDIESARHVLGAHALIGVSTHTPERAREAARQGADLVLLSPIWATPSKPHAGALGTSALTQARCGDPGGDRNDRGGDPFAHARLFALGGVTTPERATQAVRAGAHGIAGIRAFMTAPAPGQASAALIRRVDRNIERVTASGSAPGPLHSPDELG